jgi:hypothetical protein
MIKGKQCTNILCEAQSTPAILTTPNGHPTFDQRKEARQ